MSLEIRELVSRCLAGQQGAIVEFVDRFGGRVFGLCYRMLGHRQDAEDVTQESLVRALRSLGRWDRRRALEPWLLAIAGNRCRTWLAARTRRPTTLTLSSPAAGEPLQYDPDAALAEEVAAALDSLRPEYRQAFLLFHEQNMSYQEISVAFGCPLGTVKTWVHRARRQLTERLVRRGLWEEARHALP